MNSYDFLSAFISVYQHPDFPQKGGFALVVALALYALRITHYSLRFEQDWTLLILNTPLLI